MRVLLLLATVALFVTAISLWGPFGGDPGPGPNLTDPAVEGDAGTDPNAKQAVAADDADHTGATNARTAVDAGLAAADADPANGSIFGRVVDSDGRPIEGARVFVTPKNAWFEPAHFIDPSATPEFLEDAPETRTDADGGFRIHPKSADRPQSVTVIGDRFPAKRRHAPATAGQAVDIGAIELALGIVVEGVVLDHRSQAVEGARVIHSDGDHDAFYFGFDASRFGTETDRDGAFSLLLSKPGTFQLVAVHPDHSRGSFRGAAAVRGQSLSGITIQLGESADIVGRITGAPAGTEHLRVHAAKAPDPTDAEAQHHFQFPLQFAQTRADADDDGNFVLRGLEPNATYRISAFVGAGDDPWQGRAVSEESSVKAGSRDAVLPFDPGIVLTFRATDAETGRAFETLRARAYVENDTDPMANFMMFGGASKKELRAGPDGVFHMPALRPKSDKATAAVSIEANGYAPVERKEIRLPKAGTVDLGVIELTDAPTLRVTVLHAGEPVEGADVRFRPETTDSHEVQEEFWATSDGGVHSITPGRGDSRTRGRTDSDGVCVLTLEPSARGTVRVTHDDFARHDSEPISIPSHGESTHEVDVIVGGTILATLVDANGDLVTGQRIVCGEIGRDSGYKRSKETDARGIAQFDHLRDGDYALQVSEEQHDHFQILQNFRNASTGAEPPKNVARIENESTAEITLVQPTKSTITGIVTVDGVPLAGARVRISKNESTVEASLMEMEFAFAGGSKSAKTNDLGEFEIEDVEVGPIRLRVSHPKRAMTTSIDAHAEAGTTRCDIALLSTRISGRVVDSNGNPVEGARVSAHKQAKRTAGGTEESASIAYALADDMGTHVSFSHPGMMSGRTVETDRDGRFVLHGIEHGVPVIVKAKSKEFSDAESEPMQLEAGEHRERVHLSMARGGSLKVLVPGGVESFGFLSLVPEDGKADPKSQMLSGEDATFTGLHAGEWKVSLQRGTAGGTQTQTATVIPGRTTTLTFAK